MKTVRRYLTWIVVVALCACGGGGEEAASGQDGIPESLQQVPRNRTLILDCVDSGTCAGQMKDYDTFNPYIPGQTSRTGFQFLDEPLYFYNAYGAVDNTMSWIATGHEFNADYTEVEVKIRPGVKWSDGMPWTVHDFVFTINMLKANAPLLLYSTDMDTWVKEAVALDSLTGWGSTIWTRARR